MSIWTKAIILAIWASSLLSSIWQLCCVPLEAFYLDVPSGMALIILAMPLLFFTAGGFLGRHSPFYAPALAKWINAKAGENSYEMFLVNLKPILMFSVSAVVLGIGLIIEGYIKDRAGALIIGGFFLSAAAGFALMHIILRRRGVKGV